MTLYLLRHSVLEQHTVWKSVCYGRNDYAADAQATALAAQQAAPQLPQGLRVVSSPLRRCTLLAESILRLRPDLQHGGCDPRLQEIDFGAWEGQPWDAIGKPRIDQWLTCFDTYDAHGGESLRTFWQRVQQLWLDAQAHGQDCVWVTHAGVMRVLHLLAQGQSCPTRASDWPSAPVIHGGLWKLEH